MSQTQEKELTIGALQALVGDKRRRGLISDLGPPLFGLYPNGLSLNGLQGQLDYPQLDYI